MKFLIDDWKDCYRWWSVWASSVGAVLMAIFSIWPDSILLLWNMMPDQVRALLPNQLATVLAVFIFAMTVVSRLLKQPEKRKNAKESKPTAPTK